MQDSTNSQPITGLCIVSDPLACPMGYEVLYRSFDKDEDCDLWKDSFFRSKVTRYLCITRIYPLEGGKLNNVLADIVVNNDRDIPPPGFSLIDTTVDTREKATRKKQLCVRMLKRDSTTDCVTDVIILSRSKRPPIYYTLVGEINGLLLCYKMGRVPPDTISPQHTTPTHLASSSPTTSYSTSCPPASPWQAPFYPVPCDTSHAPWGSAPAVNTDYNLTPAAAPLQQPPTPKRNVQRQDSLLLPGAALEGVPFSLNAKYQDLQELKTGGVPEIHYRSLVDIENEYCYNFRLERTSAARLNAD